MIKVTEKNGSEDLHAVSQMKPDINKSDLYPSKFTSNSRSKSQGDKLYYLFATNRQYKYRINSICELGLYMNIEKSL